MNNYFDKIYVINLKKRTDRLENVEKQLKSVSISYAVIEAIDGDEQEIDFIKGAYAWNKNSAALALTTLKILEDAKANNYKRIFIFEDDVEFTNMAKHQLKDIKWLDDDEWDMIHFGTIDKYRPKIKKKGWIQLKMSYCCHAYGINSSIYDRYIEEIKKMDKPIDEITSIILQPEGRCFKYNKTICKQKKDYSNIRKKNVNYIIQ